MSKIQLYLLFLVQLEEEDLPILFRQSYFTLIGNLFKLCIFYSFSRLNYSIISSNRFDHFNPLS